MHKHPSTIVFMPRITEKAAYMSEKGVYVFNVAASANKKEVSDAIRTMFKVTPRSVRVVTVPRKRIVSRSTNRAGHTKGGKKAYVYLKQGDTIELS